MDKVIASKNTFLPSFSQYKKNIMFLKIPFVKKNLLSQLRDETMHPCWRDAG